MKRGKAQASMEYVMIAGLIAMVVLPTAFVFYNFASSSAKEIDYAQTDKFGRDVINTAERVFFLGVPSRITIEERLSVNVVSISIGEDPVTKAYLFAIAIRGREGISNLSFPTDVRLAGGFGPKDRNPGIKNVRIEAETDDSGQPVVLVSFHKQKRIFVSSSTVPDGNLGGLLGADTTCQGLADAAGIGGQWQAWLSDSTDNATTRLPDTKYVRMDGLKIANTFSDMFDNLLQNPISLDENGVDLGVQTAFTGTLANGQGDANHCSDWGSGSGGVFGRIGTTNSVTNSWTDSGTIGCSTSGIHIYCVEN